VLILFAGCSGSSSSVDSDNIEVPNTELNTSFIDKNLSVETQQETNETNISNEANISLEEPSAPKEEAPSETPIAIPMPDSEVATTANIYDIHTFYLDDINLTPENEYLGVVHKKEGIESISFKFDDYSTGLIDLIVKVYTDEKYVILYNENLTIRSSSSITANATSKLYIFSDKNRTILDRNITSSKNNMVYIDANITDFADEYILVVGFVIKNKENVKSNTLGNNLVEGFLLDGLSEADETNISNKISKGEFLGVFGNIYIVE
jgi:hypothetical protein